MALTLLDNGTTQFDETTADGTRRSVVTEPDGAMTRIIDRVDPSTGFQTTIVRRPDGTTDTFQKDPGGAQLQTTEHPDGTRDTIQTATGTDGSTFIQTRFADGSVKNERIITEADGTRRHIVKNPDGSTEVDTSSGSCDTRTAPRRRCRA